MSFETRKQILLNDPEVHRIREFINNIKEEYHDTALIAIIINKMLHDESIELHEETSCFVTLPSGTVKIEYVLSATGTPVDAK